MSQMRYDLVILRHTSEKRVEDLVQELLQLLNKANDPYLEYKLSEALLFEQNNNAVLDEIDEEQGRYFQEEFRKLQVETELRPTLQLVTKEAKTEEEPSAVYTCPACSHEQPRQKGDAMNTCNQCGVVGEKFERIKKREKVYQSEKRKLEQSQANEMKDALQRAKYEEEENLRNEARERLGIKKKSNVVNALVGIAAVGAMGVAAYFITDTLRTGDEIPNPDIVAAETEQEPKENQPLITIQGGNGNIVVNNGPSTPEGSGGPEGTQSDVKAQEGQDQTALANAQPAETNKTPVTDVVSTTESNANGTSQTPITTATQGTTTQPNTASANQVSQQNSGNAQGTQQLAALNTSNSSSTPNQIATAIPNPVVMIPPGKAFNVETQSAKQELELLQAILEPDKVIRPQIIQTTDTKQLAEHQEQLRRLLKLDKTELAIVFAETVGDSYAASQLLVAIARHESQQGNANHNSDLQLSIKDLEDTGENGLLITNNKAQIYDLTGDSTLAKKMLSDVLRQLKTDQNTPSQLKVSTLVQMAIDRSELSSNDEFLQILAELNESIQSLPKEEHIAIGRACTLMAHTAFAEDNFGAAKQWLQRVPARDARDKLLSQLDDMKIKLITQLHENKKK